MSRAATMHGHEIAADQEAQPERRRPAPMSIKDWIQVVALVTSLAAGWMAMDRRLSVIEGKLSIIEEHLQFSK